MANLALNKLPLEKNLWKRPSDATNGVIEGYSSTEGFSHAAWPINYTIELEKESNINSIRVLLWDGLGKNANTEPNGRNYKFSISVSLDGENFTTLYTNNNNEKGGNGWYELTSVNRIIAKFVRFTGHFNSANDEVHLVEFEIHDGKAPELKSKNIQRVSSILDSGLLSQEKISELIEKILNEKSKVIEGTERFVSEFKQLLTDSKESVGHIKLISKTHDYLEESSKNNRRSIFWLIAAIVMFFGFFGSLYYFIYCDSYSFDLIDKTSENENWKPYTSLLLSFYYAGKAVLLSTMLFVFGWALKNYRSERHNYVVNKHKSMTLTVATGILNSSDYADSDRRSVFDKGMEITFTHQSSGFSKEESNQPGMVNSILNRIVDK